MTLTTRQIKALAESAGLTVTYNESDADFFDTEWTLVENCQFVNEQTGKKEGFAKLACYVTDYPEEGFFNLGE